MKTKIPIIVIFCFITMSTIISAINNNLICEPGDEYYFHDVELLVFGRCRGRFSDGSWDDRLLVGNITYGGVTAFDNFLERFTILVRNQSTGEFFFKLRLKYGDIQFVNATGVFFWGSKAGGVSNLKPIVFIQCHAETVRISEGPWEE